jgi:hypothetical protein
VGCTSFEVSLPKVVGVRTNSDDLGDEESEKNSIGNDPNTKASQNELDTGVVADDEQDSNNDSRGQECSIDRKTNVCSLSEIRINLAGNPHQVHSPKKEKALETKSNAEEDQPPLGGTRLVIQKEINVGVRVASVFKWGYDGPDDEQDYLDSPNTTDDGQQQTVGELLAADLLGTAEDLIDTVGLAEEGTVHDDEGGRGQPREDHTSGIVESDNEGDQTGISHNRASKNDEAEKQGCSDDSGVQAVNEQVAEEEHGYRAKHNRDDQENLLHLLGNGDQSAFYDKFNTQ